MPFRIALSGLNAAQTDLGVTANNIANTSTNGFKGSRAEFADLFAVSLQGVSSNATGNGVRVAAVAQQFAQGNVEFTDSSLDLAVSGPGMFIVADGGALAYTRAGAYQLNRDGYVVNSSSSACRPIRRSPAAASTPAVSATCACRPRTRRRRPRPASNTCSIFPRTPRRRW